MTEKIAHQIIFQIKALAKKMDALEDRLGVVEGESITNRNRIQDIEKWQELVDKHLDCIDKEL